MQQYPGFIIFRCCLWG